MVRTQWCHTSDMRHVSDMIYTWKNYIVNGDNGNSGVPVHFLKTFLGRLLWDTLALFIERYHWLWTVIRVTHFGSSSMMVQKDIYYLWNRFFWHAVKQLQQRRLTIYLVPKRIKLFSSRRSKDSKTLHQCELFQHRFLLSSQKHFKCCISHENGCKLENNAQFKAVITERLKPW